ncbi:acyl-CoA dehydrogenase family protein [Alkalicoccus chagannorensis]|uniref:acyl-CoA dehydrogenase family protein n=1 Tax=Alkalicoccus chagannorensis TaxID=427072 RepID=UPI0014768950|nr:acyl-CoA dehydrogenase family protein [Alkalicoccus chagannorensis]
MEWQAWINEQTPAFRKQGFESDREQELPASNLQRLQEAGYPAITLPQDIGGGGLGLTEMLRLQQQLAVADGATALCIGWHVGLMYHIQEYRLWKGELFPRLAEEVVQHGALFNAAATERATGSPTRGGLPETTAVPTEAGWRLEGRKAFTSMIPMLDYVQVSAVPQGEAQASLFLVPMDLPGVAMDETWDLTAMRGTASHDLVLHGVEIPDHFRINYTEQQSPPSTGWLLHIPACYLGIAQAALEEAVAFSRHHSPNSLDTTIAALPHIRYKTGEAYRKLHTAESVLYYTAEKWEKADAEARSRMKGELGSAKMTIVNEAVDIVDLAMRICGAGSLSASSPLQRYHRDIRAGLHNPPMDDAVLEQLAADMLDM